MVAMYTEVKDEVEMGEDVVGMEYLVEEDLVVEVEEEMEVLIYWRVIGARCMATWLVTVPALHHSC